MKWIMILDMEFYMSYRTLTAAGELTYKKGTCYRLL